MASVFLDFVPPDKEDLISLHILESATQTGSFAEIEEVTPVGAYGAYLTSYTTDQATAADYWFAIQWEDDKGWTSDLSQPIQGNTSTVVGEVLQRVMQRNAGLNEMVALNITEAVVEQVFQQDPYTVDYDTVSYRQFEGMTILVLAFATMVTTAGGQTEKYTAGLVSQEISSNAGGTADTDALFALAYRWLGISRSVVAQMEQIVIAGGARSTQLDQSRLLLTEIV